MPRYTYIYRDPAAQAIAATPATLSATEPPRPAPGDRAPIQTATAADLQAIARTLDTIATLLLDLRDTRSQPQAAATPATGQTPALLDDGILTADQAAAYLKCSPGHIRRLILEGKLRKCSAKGNHIHITRDELLRYATAGLTQPTLSDRLQDYESRHALQQLKPRRPRAAK